VTKEKEDVLYSKDSVPDDGVLDAIESISEKY